MEVATEDLTPASIARALSDVSGQPFDTQHLTRADFMALETKMDYEWWINLLALVNGCVQLARSCQVCGSKLTHSEMKRDVAASRRIAPGAVDLRTWLKTPKAKAHFGF